MRAKRACGRSCAELFEKTLGVVGLGRIGALVAARMQAFG
ncbi:NAD(P)-dependent oxidoreductase, partial [Microbacterium sp. NPDC003461]